MFLIVVIWLNLLNIYFLEMVKRNIFGIVIGGFSGGEEKFLFWKIVILCIDYLLKSKLRYFMGVG